MSDPAQTQTPVSESPKSKPAAKAATPKGRIVYIGPSRAYDLPLMHSTIFIGDAPPSFCSDALKDRPHFRSCFVPVLSLGKALAELKNAKSDLAKAAGKVARETAELRASAAKGDK